MSPAPMTDQQRLSRIRQIILDVETRCMAADGPVTPTSQEINENDLQRIYALACGEAETWRPGDTVKTA
jgi:hypothetical protein